MLIPLLRPLLTIRLMISMEQTLVKYMAVKGKRSTAWAGKLKTPNQGVASITTPRVTSSTITEATTAVRSENS